MIGRDSQPGEKQAHVITDAGATAWTREATTLLARAFEALATAGVSDVRGQFEHVVAAQSGCARVQLRDRASPAEHGDQHNGRVGGATERTFSGGSARDGHATSGAAPGERPGHATSVHAPNGEFLDDGWLCVPVSWSGGDFVLRARRDDGKPPEEAQRVVVLAAASVAAVVLEAERKQRGALGVRATPHAPTHVNGHPHPWPSSSRPSSPGPSSSSSSSSSSSGMASHDGGGRPPCMLTGSGPVITRLREEIDRAARTDFAVVIEGETGAGKEMVAYQIHQWSRRRSGPWVPVNCAALVESLAEAELFGIEDRTATGVRGRRGKIEMAHGGTLFLDEVAELSPQVQAKLLRVLQDFTVQRVGSHESRRVDARLIVATNRSLAPLVAERAFRSDLFYRVNLLRIYVPPLRERLGDLVDLARLFLTEHRELGITRISPGAIEVLWTYSWPGNVRELFNVLADATTRAMARGSREIAIGDLPDFLSQPYREVIQPSIERGDTLRAWAGRYARLVLERCGNNKARACERLGISYHTLQGHLKYRALPPVPPSGASSSSPPPSSPPGSPHASPVGSSSAAPSSPGATGSPLAAASAGSRSPGVNGAASSSSAAVDRGVRRDVRRSQPALGQGS